MKTDNWPETRAAWLRLKTAWKELRTAIRHRIGIELLILGQRLTRDYYEDRGL
jgi:hypothetical protein